MYLFSIRQFRLTKRSFLVHSTMRNAPYKDLSHDSILELWWTFQNQDSFVNRICATLILTYPAKIEIQILVQTFI